MNKIKILFATFCGLLLFSCNDLVEVPESSVAQESYAYENPREAIGAVYRETRYLLGIQEYYMIQEISTDMSVAPANASGWDDGGIFKKMHFHTWNALSPQCNHLWEKPYRSIMHCNRVLDQLESGLIDAGANAAEYKAEVRGVRAFFYWLLLDAFGDVPLYINTSDELPGMNTRQEVFNFVESEVLAILNDLNQNVGVETYGRFTHWAGRMLLAELYLNAEVYIGEAHWNESLEQSQAIIDGGKFQLDADFRTPFKTNNHELSNEIIFPIVCEYVIGDNNNFAHCFSWGAGMRDKYKMNTTPWGAGTVMAIPQYIDTFDPKDKRLGYSWLMGEQLKYNSTEPCLGSYDKSGEPLVYRKEVPNGSYTSEMDGFRMNKFEVAVGAEWRLDNDFPFFRYTKVLMMKAECLLRTGKGNEAAQVVSNVRQRVFDNVDDANVTADDLIANSKYQYGLYLADFGTDIDPGDQTPVQFGGLYDELGYEFAWEAHRRRDMIRFGTYTTKSWLTHEPNGSNRTVFPLPQKAIDANPNLEQNSDYL